MGALYRCCFVNQGLTHIAQRDGHYEVLNVVCIAYCIFYFMLLGFDKKRTDISVQALGPGGIGIQNPETG